MKKLKNLWKRLKGWQKGGLIGSLFGLILTLSSMIVDTPKINNLLEFLIFMLFIYIFTSALFGIIIGYFSYKIKNKFTFFGGIIGLIIGMFSILLFETKIGNIFLYFLSFVLNVLKIFFPSSILNSGGMALAPIFIIFNIILWSFIGLITGFIIYLIKKRLDK